MYFLTVALLLAASGVKATAVLAQRAPSNLVGRDIAQGWSLQSSSAPSGTTSCGNGAYCPSSLHCNTAANDEVAACCTSSSDCRGDVEGAPKCADSSWNLWVGYDGNGFCCEAGMVGAYDTTKTVAGTCVASVGSLQSAVLTSTGTGAATTSAAASSSSASSASVTSAASVSSASSETSSKSESSASTSSAASAASTATSTGASSSGSSKTGSATSSSTSAAATGNGAEKVGMGFGLIGAAFLAVAVL